MLVCLGKPKSGARNGCGLLTPPGNMERVDRLRGSSDGSQRSRPDWLVSVTLLCLALLILLASLLSARLQSFDVSSILFGAALAASCVVFLFFSGALRSAYQQQRETASALDASEASLLESEVRFRQMADHIQEIFWMIDAHSRKALYVNRAYETITGRSRESLQRDPLSYAELIHPQDRRRIFAKLEEATSNGKFNEQFRIVLPDGDSRWIWVGGFPVRDDRGRIQKLIGTAKDVTAQKRAEEEVGKSLTMAKAAWTIEIADVCFGYPKTRWQLSIPRLNIRAGEHIAMVGENGAGKSTLAKLLTRLYDANAGSILVAGCDVRNIEIESLREHVWYAPPYPILFDTTLASNLRLGKATASDAELEAVVEDVGLTAWVGTLQAGLDQRVGPGGSCLSAGQRQRMPCGSLQITRKLCSGDVQMRGHELVPRPHSRPRDRLNVALSCSLQRGGVQAQKLPAPPHSCFTFFCHGCEPVLPEQYANLTGRIASKRIVRKERKDILIVREQSQLGIRHDRILAPRAQRSKPQVPIKSRLIGGIDPRPLIQCLWLVAKRICHPILSV